MNYEKSLLVNWKQFIKKEELKNEKFYVTRKILILILTKENLMFFKKKNKLMKAKEKAEAAVDKTNEKIEKLGIQTNNLFNTLNNLQYCFDAIRNIPKEKKLQYEELKKIRLN